MFLELAGDPQEVDEFLAVLCRDPPEHRPRFAIGVGGYGDSMGESTVLRSAARGVIAAMAMSGVRRLSTTLGLLERTPPEAILEDQALRLFERVSPERRPALVEAAHLAYGAFGGVSFGILPRRIRRQDWTGPVYGVLLWLGYEAGIAPVLGLREARRARSSVQRLALLADHLLYGLVVAASPWPYRD